MTVNYECLECGKAFPCRIFITWYEGYEDDPLLEPYKGGPDYRKRCLIKDGLADFKKIYLFLK